MARDGYSLSDLGCDGDGCGNYGVSCIVKW